MLKGKFILVFIIKDSFINHFGLTDTFECPRLKDSTVMHRSLTLSSISITSIWLCAQPHHKIQVTAP